MSYNSPERTVLDGEGLLDQWPGEVFDDQMSQASKAARARPVCAVALTQSWCLQALLPLVS